MADNELDSTFIQSRLDRWRRGEAQALDELCRKSMARFEWLARKMLRGFPSIRPVADTVDVLQSAMIRLLRTLRTVHPESTRDFVNLAAVHIRRELIDLSRRVRARPEISRRTNPTSGAGNDANVTQAAPMSHDDIDRWGRFHEEVDALPTELREVIGLSLYHGWTQAQMAELFAVDERTIRRRWRAACEALRDRLQGEFPRELK
jgi:RNA polymerase sigma-70 factor (ECF subfamily)